MREHPLDHDLEFIYDPDDFSERVVCSRCGGEKHSLLTWCPGHSLSREALKACEDGGNVIDLERFRAKTGRSPSPIYREDDVEEFA